MRLAQRQPLALLIDDAHWADAPSLRFLAYLGNRLDEAQVLLVVAARPLGEPGGAPVVDMLPAATLLRPTALSPDASEHVVRAAVPDARAPLCRTCHTLTGGNPFFLRELAGALHDAGPERAADVLEAAPDGVVASVRARLTRFPSAAQEFAGAAAVAGDGALIRHAAALTDLDERAAAEAADALCAGRILAATRPLRFVHPIVRSAVHEQLTAAACSDAHGRAAHLLAEEDAAAERVAAHLLATEPQGSEWVCDRLRAAAHEAVPRGAPVASVTYLRRALEEPPPPDSRPAVLLELGLAESLTLDRPPAIEHLRRGVETTKDTLARLYAARTLAAIVGMDDALEGVKIEQRALRRQPRRGLGARPADRGAHGQHRPLLARRSPRHVRARAPDARARRGRRGRRAHGAAGGGHRDHDGGRFGGARGGAGVAGDRGSARRSDPGRGRGIRRRAA